jgi:hypothetical protein
LSLCLFWRDIADTSTKRLETDIHALIERHKENPEPYRWTNLRMKSSRPSNASAKKPSGLYACGEF